MRRDKMDCVVILFFGFAISKFGAEALPPRKISIPTFETPFSNLTTWDTPIGRKAYLLITTDPWSIEVPPSNSLELTSTQAKIHKCAYAINAGPYHSDGTCVGSVAICGQWITHDTTSTGAVGWGRTGGTTEYYLFGSLDGRDDDETPIEDFVTGFDWLVYEGQSVAVNNTSGAQRAPRTAVGIDRLGRLMLLVVDGCEWCLRHRGATVLELAAMLIDHGALFAINLDGGGSSVMVVDGKVASKPVEGFIPGERPVSTIVCVQSGGSFAKTQ